MKDQEDREELLLFLILNLLSFGDHQGSEKHKGEERAGNETLEPARARAIQFFLLSYSALLSCFAIRIELMAEYDALEILREVQTLVSDQLQVVSYKWLCRNFSVSSNYAKRLLQEFVDMHGKELEVVYTLSGWLKSNSQTYCIKLASGINLADRKQKFEGKCSVQVYSVQASVPKDPAVLWSAEFIQAEELFNQPITAENCLRDNRFCGVSNSYVKRTVDEKSVGAISQLKNNNGISARPGISSIRKESPVPFPQGSVAQPSAKHGVSSSAVATSNGKNDKTASSAHDQTSNPHVSKKTTSVAPANKKKGKIETSSASGGSLASMWGRASVKTKSSSPAIDTMSDVQNIVKTAEDQIKAHEAADSLSSDEEADINYKRESNGASNRKRRMVMDFSDEDEDENVVSFASPDPPNATPNSVHATETLMGKDNPSIKDSKEERLEVKQEKSDERNSSMAEGGLKAGNKNNFTVIPLQKKTQSDIPKLDVGVRRSDDKPNTASTSPKRRKVLKTRIDERGREVTEVVWEGEAADSNTDKNTSSDVGSRAPVVVPMANKPQAVVKNTPPNPVTKTGNKKPAKGGGKDDKQGNILSFFRKV